MVRWTLYGVALVFVLSGCLGKDPAAGQQGSGTPTGDDSTPPPDPTGDGTTGGGAGSGNNGTGPGGGNSAPPEDYGPWPDIASATIRPGVQVAAGGSQCTSNFVFRTPDNATLYLGLAAHCVDTIKIGDPVTIGGQHGTLAYSSWKAQNLTDCDGGASAGCVNDFSLIELKPGDRNKIHPAMLHFGGPVALRDAAELRLGDKLLSYGNSDTRSPLGLPPVDPTNWHEGVVVSPPSGAEFKAVMPGKIPGDSGSGVMSKDGKAVGVFVNICISPCPGLNGIVSLKAAIDLAYAKGGLQVEVATWELLDEGVL